MEDEMRKFVLYSLACGVMIILLVCILQNCVVPGSKCDFSFLNIGNTKYEYENPPRMVLEEGVDYKAVFETDKGNFTVDLLEQSAPVTVNNFVFLAKRNYYDGVSFHRVFKDFLMQSGSRKSMDNNPDNDGTGGPGYTFEDEVNWDSLNISQSQREELIDLGYTSKDGIQSVQLEKYAIAMANAGSPNTNGSQFFIVTAANNDPRIAVLKARHTVFAKIIEGFEVVDEINNVAVDNTDPNVPYPQDKVVINRILITEN